MGKFQNPKKIIIMMLKETHLSLSPLRIVDQKRKLKKYHSTTQKSIITLKRCGLEKLYAMQRNQSIICVYIYKKNK